MPSTRKQRAKERRSRQLDIMSDTENLDVMLGSFPRNELGNDSDRNVEIDLGSDRTREDPLQNSEDFRSLLNSNSNENSVSTAETMRLVNSEITKKIDELRRELNSQLVDVINSAITEKVLPDIRNLVSNQNPVFREEVDQRSSGLNRTTEAKFVKNAWKGNSKLNLATSNRQDYFRRNSENSQSSDDGHEEDILTNSHDMVTGAKPTPRTVPEFLTGRPMHSREETQNSHSPRIQTLENVPPVQETDVNDGSDPIRRLADVLVGMNNKSSTQTLMVRPVSTTTLTFDGKSEKFELFEDLFHTMVKMQPEMTETMKINHFHSLLRKNALQTFRNISTANRQTLEDVLAVFRRKYVKPESQATAKHKWHKLVFDPNTMKLPDFLEELNQGAEKAFGENAQAMIDSLLYAKLPPKLKRSVNMARLENASYEEIVTHLERELELNGLEGGDDIPVPTMSTAPTATRPGTGLLSSGIDPNITCNYCKKPGHVKDDCRKLKRKEEQRRNDGQDTKKEYPKCPTCGKTNHPAERCWKGAGAHLKPKNLKLEDAKQDEASPGQNETKDKQSTSILKNSKN